jgi:hypothetical protein
MAKDEAKAALDTAMRDFTNASIRYNRKMTSADKLFLGVPTRDPARALRREVTDTVDMTITNDPAVDSHRHIIHYKRLGAESRSKDPYHLAVFQTYIQGPGESEPRIDDDAAWSKDITNMASPFVQQHRSADAGKTCWYRSRWEALNNAKGPWSMERAMIP